MGREPLATTAVGGRAGEVARGSPGGALGALRAAQKLVLGHFAGLSRRGRTPGSAAVAMKILP